MFRLLGGWLQGAAMAMLAMIATVQAQSVETLDLHAGAVRVIDTGPIERVAVGRDTVLGTSALEKGQLLLIGLAPGETDLRVWLKDGSTRMWQVTVTDKNIPATVATLSSLLAEFPKLEVRAINGIVVVEGDVPPDRLQAINTLVGKVPGVVSLLVAKSVTIETLVKNFPGTRWHDEGGTPVIEGEVSAEDFERYKKALEAFPNVLSLVRQTNVKLAPMVRVSMRLLEVNREATQRYGINWDDAFAGPSIGSTGAFRTNPFYRVVPQNIRNPITAAIPVTDYRWHAYAGWTTEVFSIIELLEQENKATVLAEPNLSTRSGSPARFLAGGELPYPVIGQFGQPGVAFKEYGIKFEIAPSVDYDNNIQTQILVDVSTIDRANAVDNVPGLLIRRTESAITVRPGQTIILSGLVSAEELRNIQGVPGLSKIPILGELFKSRNFQSRKTELVVLVTPDLVSEPRAIDKETADQIERMRHLIHQKVLDGAIAE